MSFKSILLIKLLRIVVGWYLISGWFLCLSKQLFSIDIRLSGIHRVLFRATRGLIADVRDDPQQQTICVIAWSETYTGIVSMRRGYICSESVDKTRQQQLKIGGIIYLFARELKMYFTLFALVRACIMLPHNLISCSIEVNPSSVMCVMYSTVWPSRKCIRVTHKHLFTPTHICTQRFTQSQRQFVQSLMQTPNRDTPLAAACCSMVSNSFRCWSVVFV